ncbi:carbon-nitrogen hydrolase family protein [Priestia abyssalis]|uniref:carbon-nitrogen hydrolase family protein n=1 Tax=Priestia abyssalis TaxID=1221450 RepID=UPI0009950EE5|nr:carbon-nitrogen hydrolase family protein [Priestia abyssalis]
MTLIPKIAVAQAAFKNGDLSYNQDKMEKMVKQCKKQHPDTRLIVFPELSATGYFLSPEVKDLAQHQDGSIFDHMRKIAEQYEMWMVYGYVEKDSEGQVYNSIQLIDPTGKLAGNYRKIHLTPLEKEVFTPGSDLVTVETELGTIGLMICWDLAFPELARSLALQGADLIAAPSAWEAPYDAPFIQFAAARAIDNTIYVAAGNQIGTSEGLTFFGKSAIFAPDGTTISIAGENEERIITASLHYDWREDIKNTFFTMLADRRPDLYK